MKPYEFKVGWCKDCAQGWIEVVKENNSETLILECSECSIQWRSIGSLKLAQGTYSYLGGIDTNDVVYDVIMSDSEPEEIDIDDEFDSIKIIQTTKPTLGQINKKKWDQYIL